MAEARTNLFVNWVLVVGICLVASCKREERTFRVRPAEAKITEAPPNTTARAGGVRRQSMTVEFPSPPPVGPEVNANALAEGQRLFEAMNCAGCHGSHGGGGMGPALSDEKWIYGWEPAVIFDSIVHGRPNGMPAFGGELPDHQVWEIVGYVRSLSGMASKQAAGGRSENMGGALPPNSIERGRPGSSQAQLKEIVERERTEFGRWGWIEADSGQVRIPDEIVQGVAQQSSEAAARKNRTTGPTSAASDPEGRGGRAR